jgi:hypothetical protein
METGVDHSLLNDLCVIKEISGNIKSDLRLRGKHMEHTLRYRHGQCLSEYHSKTQEIRLRIGIWNCIKLKSSWATKKTSNRMKRQPTKWEKSFVKYSSERG